MGKRAVLSVKEKKDVCVYRDQHPDLSHQNIANHFSLLWGKVISRRCVGDILSEKEKWIKEAAGASASAKRLKGAKYEQLEDALTNWINEVNAINETATEGDIKEHAKIFGDQMGITDLTYSNGWLRRFKQRHGLTQPSRQPGAPNFSGLVIMVTGGASGLGRATVQRLFQYRAKVIICDLQTSKGEEIAKHLGEGCVFIPTDVTSEDDVKTAIHIIGSVFGKLDAVVNCAGIGLSMKTYDFKNNLSHPLDAFVKVMTVNTVGTFNVVCHAACLMGNNEPDSDGYRGVIINTSGTAAFEGQLGQAAVAASKAAVNGMTLPIARDLASQGIRCCTISPGYFDTPGESVTEEKLSSMLFPTRAGRPDEFAHLVQFIIENPMINGEVIRLDGGLRLSSCNSL